MPRFNVIVVIIINITMHIVAQHNVWESWTLSQKQSTGKNHPWIHSTYNIIWIITALGCTYGSFSKKTNRLDGLAVKASAWRAEDPGFESRLRQDFSDSSHTSDSKNWYSTVATLPGTWWYRVSTGTDQSSISILWLGEVKVWSAASISVWQHVKLSEQIGPWDTLACCRDVKQPTNKLPKTGSVMTWMWKIESGSFLYF